ncbi:MAG: hypothetical protein ACXWLH_02330 [Candidatus Saccharimonadales bacterium]
MLRKKKQPPESIAPDDASERLPIYKRAQCLGEACMYFSGKKCSSRLELLEAKGTSGGPDLAPLVEDCSYALYGQVCMGGDEQVVVKRIVESPNHNGNPAELVARAGRTENQRIVLNTPVDSIHFAD